jgi:hypothetical protein
MVDGFGFEFSGFIHPTNCQGVVPHGQDAGLLASFSLSLQNGQPDGDEHCITWGLPDV